MDGEGKVMICIRDFDAARFPFIETRWGPPRLWLADAERQGTITDEVKCHR